jgi:heptose-I-phosphate ethanolaminephosphotransferase
MTSTPSLSQKNSNNHFSWSQFSLNYLFFFYFSGFYQLFLFLSQQSGFNGFRQTIYMSFLWLIPLILFPKQTKFISLVIGFVLWASSLVLIGYYAIYGQNFSQSVLFILFESNFSESSEYIESYFSWWIIFGFLLYSVLAIFLWKKINPITLIPKNRTFLTILLLFIVTWPTFNRFIIEQTSLTKALHTQMNRMEPAAPWHLVFGFVKYKEQLYQIEKNLLANKNLPPLQGLINHNAKTKNTLVLVIGESTNRQRMHLYNYSRETTPNLTAMKKELLVFDNIYSPRPYTIETLEQVLTFADQKHPDLYLKKPTLINMMKQAGYKTYWITNQQTQTKRNTMLTTFSKQADEQIYLNNDKNQNSAQYDGVVLKPFNRILNNNVPNKFIVIHLLGTHRKYNYRYPKKWAFFEDNNDLPQGLNSTQAKEYNEYDNAIRYNDYVISSLITSFKTSQQNGFLVYFSDHGEEVYDYPQQPFAGRNEASPSAAMYTIPFLIWQSESWKKQHPLNKNIIHRSYSTADFIYTWADLAGIYFDEFNAHRSLINPLFTNNPIWIGDPNQPNKLRDLQQQPFKKVRL